MPLPHCSIGLLTMQKEIAGEVSQRLRSRLPQSDRQPIIAKGSINDPEAYRLYLKGCRKRS